MFGKETRKEKTIDLWGVDMAESALKAMRDEVNSDCWKQCFEPWFIAQISFLRSKLDDAKPDELVPIQKEIKWLKRLAEMRNDFNARKL